MIDSAKAIEVIETLFVIPNKEGEIVPFKLNSVQKHLMENKGLRTDVLKARQFGVTSIIMAWFLVECMTKFTRAVMIAHDSDATRKLLQRGRFMLQNMKGPKPSLGRDSDQELSFTKTGSTFYIGTAGTRTFGRSDTITHLHCSEYAFWPDPKTLSAGLFQAVPHKTGVVMRESTANGYGTYHHQQIIRAIKGSSRFKLAFYPWYIFPEYESLTPLTGPLDDKEIKLRNKYALSDSKLQWRREKIEDMGGDENLFCQEYPSSIEEAFLVTGGSMFPQVQSTPSEDWAKARELSRELGGSLFLLLTHVTPIKSGGSISARSRALPGYHYCIGADSSGGTGNDYSEAHVLCLETMEQVGVFRTNTLAPPKFALALSILAQIFNNAYIVPEANSHGLSTISCLKGLEPFKSHPLQIYRQRLLQRSHVTNRMAKMSAHGFKTTSTSKPYLIGVLQSLLPEITLYDEPTVDQLRGFGERAEGDLGNIESGHDDAVISLALACEGILKLRMRFPVQVQSHPSRTSSLILPSGHSDLEDILSRIHTPSRGWINLFTSEAPHGHHLRN